MPFPSFDRPVLDPADPREASREALRRWLRLQRRLVLCPQEAVRVLTLHPEPAAALRAARPDGEPRDGVAASDLERELRALARLSAVALPWTSPAYPEAARRLADAAPLLLVRGDWTLLSRPALAIVGARAATAYGRAEAERFAARLAEAGLVIVSGLATGVDAVAHEAALEAGGVTVAVQACGPDRVYPARHRRLAERIAERGALVTEFPLGWTPRPAYFPLRNRLISAFSRGVLVVEARERSGSLVTATHAGHQGLDVWAVPGPLHSPASAGTNRLLADGALVALSPDWMLEKLRAGGGLPAARAPRRRLPSAASLEARRLVKTLLDQPRSRDELARALGWSPAQLAPPLLELELAGAVAEDRDGRLRVVSPGKARGL